MVGTGKPRAATAFVSDQGAAAVLAGIVKRVGQAVFVAGKQHVSQGCCHGVEGVGFRQLRAVQSGGGQAGKQGGDLTVVAFLAQVAVAVRLPPRAAGRRSLIAGIDATIDECEF